MLRTLLIFLIPLVLLSPIAAQAPETPPIVLSGLRAYQAFGRDSAVAVWTRGSPIEGQVGSQVMRGMEDIETAYGSATDHEILANVAIGRRVIRSYVVVYFTRGPMYAWFDCYRSNDSWITVGFLFNTRPQEILPRAMLEPAQRRSQ